MVRQIRTHSRPMPKNSPFPLPGWDWPGFVEQSRQFNYYLMHLYEQHHSVVPIYLKPGSFLFSVTF